jgi:alpha-tubulin suppressor-like RCC1 family protein
MRAPLAVACVLALALAEEAYDDEALGLPGDWEARVAEASEPAPEAGFHRDPAGSTVSAGHFHTCALRASEAAEFGGIAHCWGFDAMGQVSRAPPDVPFIQLSSGHFHSCGVTLEEKILCWGDSRETTLAPVGLFQQVTAGQFHSCGLTRDGAPRCWGEDHLTGATRPPPGAFVQLEAGADFTCGLRPSARVECWGGDAFGQASPPADEKFVQIAASTSSPQACGVTLDGNDLVCWGQNTKGQAPRRVAGPFAQVATGYKTTCAIAGDGADIRCFGVSAHVFETADQPHFAGHTWEQVSVGSDHICALDVDGAVVCHGQPTQTARDVPPGFVAA